MVRKKTNGSGAPMTTAQALGTLVKSARDIMRKDKGLNGDLDRLPLLTWIMFLKFLDDLELQREEEAQLGRNFARRLRHPIAGAIGQLTRKALPATSFSPSSTRTRRAGRMARVVRACSPICVAFPAPMATTAGMLLLPCFAASITA
jgi:hypothetical protein